MKFKTRNLKRLLPFTAFFLSALFSYGQKIAITQITSHEALDAVHQGALDALKEAGFSEEAGTEIIFANPQGDIATAVQIANRFAGEHPNVIIAIATPSAQTILKAVSGMGIPVVFATVSDPISAHLVKDLQHPGGQVTGTRNQSPIKQQLAMLKRALPKVKSIGIVLNFSESNSVSLFKAIELEAKEAGLMVYSSSVSNSSEVLGAAKSLLGRIDVYFLILDNTVASGLPALIKASQESHIPVFSTYTEAVAKGALMGLAYNEYSIGQQTGVIAARILKGEKPGDIPVEDPKTIDLIINQRVANKLGITLDPSLYKEAIRVYP